MVILDYIKREESDISFKVGNVVEVIEKNEYGELCMIVCFYLMVSVYVKFCI